MLTMKNSPGFTLMEVLIVMIIISIIVSIGVISGRAQIGKARVEQEVRQLYTDLVSARMSAMNRSRNQFLVVNAALRRYEIWEDTNPAPFGNEQQTAADTRLVQTTMNNLITVVTGTSPFAFDTRGLASPSGTLRIGDGGFNPRVDCITISATRIRIGRFEGGACVS